MYDFKKFSDKGILHKVIRGEESVFVTPPEVNAERKPTDHNVMLEQSVYPNVGTLSKDSVVHALETALRDSCTDGLGVFCSIQCYYSEVVNEEFGSPLLINQQDLPIYLGQAINHFQSEMKKGILFGADNMGRELELALSYINILQSDYNIDFGIKF
jgi:hypothetical protein